MFLGEYHTRFTSAGRVILPKKFREGLLGKREIVLSRGLEGCIWGFSLPDFENEAKRQLEVSVTDVRARDLRRYLFSAAESVTLDDQGRFVIPKVLLEYAGLEDESGNLGIGEVVIIGAGDHFEIWNPRAWQELVGNFTKSNI